MNNEKTLDLGILAGEVDVNSENFPEPFQKDAYLGHLSAFDYYHPVDNFLYRMGIKDYERFHEIVEEGTKIIPTENMKTLTRRYIEEWIQLVQDRKNGIEAMPLDCLFGRIQPEYDRERLEIEKERKKGFERSVRTLCSIAGYDPQETLGKMLD